MRYCHIFAIVSIKFYNKERSAQKKSKSLFKRSFFVFYKENSRLNNEHLDTEKVL